MIHSHSHFRTQRVSELVQKELANLLRIKALDPRFQEVTVTYVDVAPDLHNAKIFIVVHDEKKRIKTLQALNKAQGFFRREIAHAVDLRITHKLSFVYGESIGRGRDFTRLIDQEVLKKET